MLVMLVVLWSKTTSTRLVVSEVEQQFIGKERCEKVHTAQPNDSISRVLEEVANAKSRQITVISVAFIR